MLPSWMYQSWHLIRFKPVYLMTRVCTCRYSSIIHHPSAKHVRCGRWRNNRYFAIQWTTWCCAFKRMWDVVNCLAVNNFKERPILFLILRNRGAYREKHYQWPRVTSHPHHHPFHLCGHSNNILCNCPGGGRRIPPLPKLTLCLQAHRDSVAQLPPFTRLVSN